MSTYRQSSLTNEDPLERDKEPTFGTRPLKRLTGEMLRNNVLAASGLLNRTIGGKSVKPYQPEGLWKINGASYNEDKGESYTAGACIPFGNVPCPTLQSPPLTLLVDRFALSVGKKQTPLFKPWL